MLATHLFIQNRTSEVLHVVLRSLNGTLLIMLFPDAKPNSYDIPPGMSAAIATDETISSCLHGSQLRFNLRNRSGRQITLGAGIDMDSGNPALVILPPDYEDDDGDEDDEVDWDDDDDEDEP